MQMRAQAQEGFSFMELVIVILIMGILAGVGVPAYMRWAKQGSINATHATLNSLSQAIDLYKLQIGNYPKRLVDLVEKPKGPAGKKWTSPYLKKAKIPSDGWGNGFYYKLTPGGKHPYELYSYGPNGPDAADPGEYINVWEI